MKQINNKEYLSTATYPKENPQMLKEKLERFPGKHGMIGNKAYC